MNKPKSDKIWEELSKIPDPEIPVINLVEMGIIRDLIIENESTVRVIFTPTFSGCPAQQTMKIEIEKALKKLGIKNPMVETQLSPPWSTDWISPTARLKLKQIGISPAPIHKGNITLTFFDVISCPYCESTNTSLRNNWGPTPCRMIYYCNKCQQPFEQFKAL